MRPHKVNRGNQQLRTQLVEILGPFLNGTYLISMLLSWQGIRKLANWNFFNWPSKHKKCPNAYQMCILMILTDRFMEMYQCGHRGPNVGPTWGRQDPGGPHVGHNKLCHLGSHNTRSIVNRPGRDTCRNITDNNFYYQRFNHDIMKFSPL